MCDGVGERFITEDQVRDFIGHHVKAMVELTHAFTTFSTRSRLQITICEIVSDPLQLT